MCSLIVASILLAAAPYTTWSDYGGSRDSMQYSALDQIDKSNVKDLTLAWSYRTPEAFGSRMAFSPLVADGVMYVIGKGRAVVALDAATGQMLWSRAFGGLPTYRGFSYWENKDRSDRRLLFSVESYLYAVDARSGAAIPSFGDKGRVDLRPGVPRARPDAGSVHSNTPGRIFENLILMGSGTGEQYDAPPGDLRAFDVVTGALVWTFHTIPHPGELGYDTWPPDAWKYAGGANAWGEISVDEARGIAYFPLGSPTYDFYGADRKGANLFGNCLLALDARTGKRLWHFQAVHHDLWDYDLATAPKLLTVRHKGKPVDVVAQATKTGFLYVFDRVTGEPLWPIEERPVPKSDVPGEQAWPTQPFPSKPPPFSRQTFTVADLNPHLGAAERVRLRALLEGARNEGIFTPPGLRVTVAPPGQYGGANWGAMAADPQSAMLYVRALDLPTQNRLTPARPMEMTPAAELKTPSQQGALLFRRNCIACHGDDRARLDAVGQKGLRRFRTVLREGQGQMPGFTFLAEKEVDALFAFLSTPGAADAAGAKRDRDVADAKPPAYAEGQTRYYGRYADIIEAEDGQPAIAPPWAEIVAYDLNEGVIRWRVPLGTVSSLAARGIKDTGSYRASRNGLVATAGGLLFAASASDRTVHAYDKDSGAALWERELEANPDGIPAVYAVNGRQYVAFFVGSSRQAPAAMWKRGDPTAQGYYVFALPPAKAAKPETRAR